MHIVLQLCVNINILILLFAIFYGFSVSSKTLLQRPIAGSQVPFCPIDKKMLDCWSHIEPGTFKVRGVTYFK